MTFSIGIDIGGTKIAGAVFDKNRQEIDRHIRTTPETYSDLVTICVELVKTLDDSCGARATVGVGIPCAFDRQTGNIIISGNTKALGSGKPLRRDLEKALGRPVKFAHDASCAALSEAIDGVGAGYNNVLGLIMGTGVGGGLVINQRIVEGVTGTIGEYGHMPLPFREDSDGPTVTCICRQVGCIERTISGSGLVRLYTSMTGETATAEHIGGLAREKDADALRVLDQFYTTVAKAMVPFIHMLDPEMIVISGGLVNLPGMIDEVPKRWGKYTIYPDIKTKFAAAKHGALTGLRGAAWVGSSK